MIDLRIPGDPGAIHDLANWLDRTVEPSVIDLELELAYVAADSQDYWRGRANAAFRDCVAGVRTASQPLAPYLRDAAEVFRAYANRLDRGRADFAEARADAVDAGLLVVRDRVHVPMTTLSSCPTHGAPADDIAEFDGHVRRVRAYDELSAQVGTWWGELDAWIAEYLVPLTVRLDDFIGIDGPLDALEAGNADIVNTALDVVGNQTKQSLSEYRQLAVELQNDADRFTRELRSGNPAVRAAAQAADPAAMRAGLGVIADAIGDVAKYTDVIPIAGDVIDVVSAGADIAEGEPPTSVGVGFVAGAGAGAGAGVFVGALGAPPVAAAVAVATASITAGHLGKWLWEAAVPLDVREAIDASLANPRLSSEPTGTWAVGTR